MSSLLQSTANTRQVLPGSFRYLRSDAPLAPTQEDVAFLLDHEITFLVDLRSEQEICQHPCPLASHPGFTYRSLPVSGGSAMPDSSAEVPRSYLRMVDNQMARILRTVMESASNVMFFCTAGKDRTGVVSALLQRQAGLPREYIIADYVQSGENLKTRFAAFMKDHPNTNVAVYTPAAAYMEQFLDFLDA